MPDPGAVERNEKFHQIAHERAAARNGGQHQPVVAPQSVVSSDSPACAVEAPRRQVSDDTASEPEPVEVQIQQQQQRAADGMSWGRSGATEISRERSAPPIPESVLACTGIPPQAIGIAPDPRTFFPGVRPAAGGGGEGNMNAADIFNTKIGG